MSRAAAVRAKADAVAADRVLRAACVETIRQLRSGETTYVIELASAIRAADLLIGEPRD